MKINILTIQFNIVYMAQKDWQDILLQHTRYFTNGRYDILEANNIITNIASVKSDEHMLKNKYYKSYGTYRHNILPDTSLIKINETAKSEREILNTFYNPDTTDYIFPGIVLQKNYAVNGNELTLEDLFAEYGYDYLYAIDQSCINQGKEPIYFEKATLDHVAGIYEILKIGKTFYDNEPDEDDEIDNQLIVQDGQIITTNSKKKVVEYDGTYCPTVDEIIKGELYIVIKSGDKINKIKFNNKAWCVPKYG